MTVFEVTVFVPSLAVTVTVSPGVAVPTIVTAVSLVRLTGLVAEVIVVVTATVDLVAVMLACPVLPFGFVAAARKVIVPSSSALTSIPEIVQVPSLPTVVVCKLDLCVPSDACNVIVAPATPVPETATAVSLPALIGFVTLVTATVLLTAVPVAVAVLLLESVAVAVKVIVPSLNVLTSMPLTDQVPSLATVVVTAVDECVPSLATTDTVAPTSPVPLAVVSDSLPILIGLVTEVTAMVLLAEVRLA